MCRKVDCHLGCGAGRGVATPRPAAGCPIGFIRFRKGKRLGTIAAGPFHRSLWLSELRLTHDADGRHRLAALCPASIEVAVPQPRHVRAFALFGLKLARQARCR
jgi:hypothetical protein